MKHRLKYYLKQKNKDLRQIQLWLFLITITAGITFLWWLITLLVF